MDASVLGPAGPTKHAASACEQEQEQETIDSRNAARMPSHSEVLVLSLSAGGVQYDLTLPTVVLDGNQISTVSIIIIVS
jgi:hypothetical protein